MKIVITECFKKNLSKIKSVSLEKVLELLKKYPNTKDLIVLETLPIGKILKGYLFSKKIRFLVLFTIKGEKIIPLSIVKKETTKGKNITKQNYKDLFLSDIDKSIISIEKKDFEEINL